MRARRDAAVRLLKTMMVASLVIPAAIFGYASWVAYNNTYAHADEQLWAKLGIMSEHTRRIFQSVDLTFTSWTPSPAASPTSRSRPPRRSCTRN